MTNFLQGVAGLIVAACIASILAVCFNRAVNHDDLYPIAVVVLLAVGSFMVGVIQKLEMVVDAELKAERKK